MRKNIFCFGCSFTNGNHFEQKDWRASYPYQLSLLMPDVDVYNLGVSGGNNILNDMIIKKALEEYSVDFSIVQFTFPNRFYISSSDSSEKIGIRHGVKQLSDNYYLLSMDYVAEYFKVFTPSNFKGGVQKIRQLYKLLPKRQIEHINEAAYLSTLYRLKDSHHYTWSWSKGTLGTNVVPDRLKLEQFDDGTGHLTQLGNQVLAVYLKGAIV
jgi:hypothetical protein